jgi:hypothetical protein
MHSYSYTAAVLLELQQSSMLAQRHLRPLNELTPRAELQQCCNVIRSSSVRRHTHYITLCSLDVAYTAAMVVALVV